MPLAGVDYSPKGFMITKSPPERKSMKVQHYAAVMVGLFVIPEELNGSSIIPSRRDVTPVIRS